MACASWNFILWGLFFGVLIALERLGLRNLLEKLPGFISHFYLLFAVLISWVIFYFTDLSRAAQYLGIMFGLSGQPLTNSQTLLALEGNLFWLDLAVVFCLPLARDRHRQQITGGSGCEPSPADHPGHSGAGDESGDSADLYCHAQRAEL